MYNADIHGAAAVSFINTHTPGLFLSVNAEDAYPTTKCHKRPAAVCVGTSQTMGRKAPSVRGLLAASSPSVFIPVCRAQAGGHWLPSAPWRISLDTGCLSHACCAVGCPKHDEAMALNLNEHTLSMEER